VTVTPKILSLVSILGLMLAGCGKSSPDDAPIETDPLTGLMEQANEQTLFHQIKLDLTTPLTSGQIHLYRLLDQDVAQLETRRFDHPNPSINLGYSAPLSIESSAVLVHIVTGGLTAGRPDEFMCFAEVDHSTTRHNYELACDLASTVTYYLSGEAIGRSGQHPFHDIKARLPLWSAMIGARENDVVAFYVSIFGTLQNALAGLGRKRFDPARHSLRPIMETIVAQFIDRYQRQGHASVADIVDIANAVTDSALPLERLARYQTVFEAYAHVEDIDLKNTGGSLTQRVRELELLSMASELGRFYLRDSPFEMSDYRTHVVQNIQHEEREDAMYVRWDPIPHMFGYNAYFNGQHVGYSRLPQLRLPNGARGTVTIKAVGYAGEFDGVHHELAELSLLAGVESDAD